MKRQRNMLNIAHKIQIAQKINKGANHNGHYGNFMLLQQNYLNIKCPIKVLPLCMISGFCHNVKESALFWNFMQCEMVVCYRSFMKPTLDS